MNGNGNLPHPRRVPVYWRSFYFLPAHHTCFF
jgi:hypothetical protein